MTYSWGNSLYLRLSGASHGPTLGMVLEGLPPGLALDEAALTAFTRRRAPGHAPWASARQEEDTPVIISGITNGRTTGGPLEALIKNTDAHSEDYLDTAHIPRPSHADFPARARFGPNIDLRGGGVFSGRMTAPLTLAGGICLQILAQRDIFIGAHLYSVADIEDTPFDPVTLSKDQLLASGLAPFPVISHEAGERMIAAILTAQQAGDSLGGIIECAALGLPVGLGAPLFGGLENRLAQVLFAIPALKGLEFGAGFAATRMRGSENNDPFILQSGRVRTITNHHGGILGGLASGMPLLFRVAVKPTPSIALEQQSVDLNAMRPATLCVKGRHDPCIAPRAVAAVEAAAALALLDALLEQNEVTSWN